MATIPVTDTDEFNRAGTRRAEWDNLTTGDDGAPIDWSEFADRSVQVFGTFGGATVTLQGSNDLGPNPTNWNVLTDLQGNALNFTTAGLEMVAEPTCWIRPVVTGGTGTSINVQMFMRRR